MIGLDSMRIKSVPAFNTPEELIAHIRENEELSKAFESMATSNSAINIEFIKFAKPESFSRILEITQSVADGKKKLNAQYPQRPTDWDDYRKLEDGEMRRVGVLMDELIGLLE